MDVRIPPLKLKIMLESNPPKSGILVRRLAVKDIRMNKLGVSTLESNMAPSRERAVSSPSVA